MKEFDMDTKIMALREAMNAFPRHKAIAVMKDCGLTKDECESITEKRDGADLIYISTKLNVSDRTVDNYRARGFRKLINELNI